ncbi:hypothetical protein AVEN_98259-1 [Araneus ventricosus]|uniref:Uncharacterized protein n=1 Tax=Araneus ventricosus TaxID=182803 RepID=A0A4Y2TDT1_ARAVE|nr:hypothetical protein AVEN_98259-1 [Araneus ventricosus]
MEGKAEARKHAFAAYDCKIQIRKKPVVPIFKATEREEITRFCGSWSRFALRKKTVCGAQRGRIRTPYLRRRGHGQEWVRAVEESTTQRQHSQGNRPDVLGTPDPELENQGHAMSKHSRTRSHHSLLISDPHWATPTTTPLGQIKTNPSGLLNVMHRPHSMNQ